MGLFSLFAGPLGHLMRWIYNLGTGYFLALILFTVLTRLILFPLSIKNQKNQADRARLAPRLERIQKKYGQDRQKMMMKQQELYEKEGVKMTGGCLPMLVQMLVLFSVIAVIYKPLTYIQSIPESDINACISVVDENWDDPKKADSKYTGYYRELNLFKAIEDDETLQKKMEWAIVDSRLDKDGKKDTLTLSQYQKAYVDSQLQKAKDAAADKAVADKKAEIDAELEVVKQTKIESAVKDEKQKAIDAAVEAAKKQAETDGVEFDEAKFREEAAADTTLFDEAKVREDAAKNFDEAKERKAIENKYREEAEKGVTFSDADKKKHNAAAEDKFYKDNAKLFTDAENTLNTIVKTGKEFSIFGFSLLEQPWQKDLRPNGLWIIAILSGLTALFSSLLSMKYSKAAMSLEQQQAGGCTNAMMYMMPLMSLIFSFTVPAGVAVYWTFSNLLAMVQTVILNAMWNPAKIRAQAEIEYQQRRQKRREDKERLKAARLAEQAAWQEEENKARARAKGDITQKKSAASKATSAELPNETAEKTDGNNEEEATNE